MSEAYSWLFKLLCRAGDTVLVPQPSYPLFEQLTELESVRAHPYLLATSRPGLLTCRLSPTPPTTHARFLSSPRIIRQGRTTRNDFAEVEALCRRRGWALIADEVFADYPLEAAHPLTDIAAATDVLSFSLGGLSKTVGLPQLKLGWMIVGGSAPDRTAALASLELIADTYLSVGTPVQIAPASAFGPAPRCVRPFMTVSGTTSPCCGRPPLRIRHVTSCARKVGGRRWWCAYRRSSGKRIWH